MGSGNNQTSLHENHQSVDSVLVVGGGVTGLLVAVTLKRKLPELEVEVIRSADDSHSNAFMDEGSPASLPVFLHGALGLDPGAFHRVAQPTYRLGTRFHWGTQDRFHSTFTGQFHQSYPSLSRPSGYYCTDKFDFADVTSALMAHGKAFERQASGAPLVLPHAGYQIETERLEKFLEAAAIEIGVTLTEDQLENATAGEQGIASLQLKTGRSATADLFIDCSGSEAKLLRGALNEKFVAFERSLFPDHAIVGSWQRGEEPLNAFGTVETMNAGWAWQTEQATALKRGYVFFSHFLSIDEAEKEFRDKNPKLGELRIAKFQSGRCQRTWVGNVVALGDSAGLVEPLQSTALAALTDHANLLAICLRDTTRQILPRQVTRYNQHCETDWEEIRRFLALHYKYNTRLDTPFWKACQMYTDLAGAEAVVEQFREVGPSRLWADQVLDSQFFGLDGYHTMLLGMSVDYAARHQPSDSEIQAWNQIRSEFAARAQKSLTQEEGLRYLRSEGWQWRPEFYLELAARRFGSAASHLSIG